MLEMVSKIIVFFFQVFWGSMPFHLLMSLYKNNLGLTFYQERSLATIVLFLSEIYTYDTFRLYYHNKICYIAGSTHKQYEASPAF